MAQAGLSGSVRYGLADSGRSSARPIRVLLVDDSLVARTVLARLLEGRPEFEIAGAAPTADQAIVFLATHEIDIVVLDRCPEIRRRDARQQQPAHHRPECRRIGDRPDPRSECSRASVNQPPLRLDDAQRGIVLQTPAGSGVLGAASYDGVVALEAKTHGRTLLTLDKRAQSTYRRFGVPYTVTTA